MAQNVERNSAGGSIAAAAREPDLELLRRWRDGDERAGQALVGRYFHPLYRFFANKCADADELVQSTLLAVVGARDQFRADASFRTYLFTIARHKLYRYLRALKSDREVDFSITSVAELVTTPGTRLDRDAAQRRLAAAMRELSVEHQTLLELYYWEGIEVAELAQIFETRPATVRTWLFRARSQLREKLGHEPRSKMSGTTIA
jgi:RNA polymerase sigma-70 factor (ECF subfamily)